MMAEEASTPVAPLLEVAAPEATPAQSETVVAPESQDNTATNGSGVVNSAPEVGKTDATPSSAQVDNGDSKPDITNGGKVASDKPVENKPAEALQDVEMKELAADKNTVVPSDSAPAVGESTDGAAETPASSSKAKPTARRKSGGVPEHKGKKLTKKASKAKITHSDARPGDHFFVRLKGYPLWPAIVCDETMLPDQIIKSRPVTAARADGTYRADYADGGPKVKDRTFPVMYLQTNEFGWIPNTDLVDLDPETVMSAVTQSMRRDLAAAHELAAKQNPLDYYKDILQQFVEAKAAEAEKKAADLAAKEAAKAAKKAAKKATPKKSKVVDAEGDIDMDAIGEPDDEGLNPPGADEKPAKGKKRKPEDDAETPQRSDSVKKPKTTIKLNTPKTNGTATPKSAKDSTKISKPKTKKAKATEPPEEVAPKEPELSPEEKRLKKEKEILYLRHKLQKGLLTRDQDPKEEEMQQMSEFVKKLEDYAELEVSIIRVTKINKVLKAILKLTTIPREEEFNFKPRSTALLDKWNKLLASEQGTPAAGASTNGNGSEAKGSAEDAKASPSETTNGNKETPEDSKSDAALESKTEDLAVEAPKPEPVAEIQEETKDTPASVAPAEQSVKESVPESAAVESSA